MPERSIHTILRDNFHETSQEAWKSIASQELSHDKPLESLTWKIGNLAFNPYYDHSDAKNFDYLTNFRRLPYSDSAPQYWANMPIVKISGESSANALALNYLSGGADGILFDATTISKLNLDELLHNINLSICEASFITANNKTFVREFAAYAKKKEYNLEDFRGTIYDTSRVETKDLVLPEFRFYHTLGIIVQPSTPVDEISTALFKGVQYMDSLTEMGVRKEQLIKTISLSFTAAENFFITIATLKAVRLLWYQLSQAFEIENYFPNDLHIHLFAAPWRDEKFDPHGNMLKNTFQGMAGIFGGANALTLSSTDVDNEMLNRTALNISNILKEEAYIDKVADPTAGAYALNNMVDTLAKAAWQNFQNKMHEA